jgi:mannose-6-phosphate isomerase-like protein (cupin superfamily)
MVDRYPIGTVNNCVQILKDQIFDYDSYVSGRLKIIGYPGYKFKDCIVKDLFTFSQWIEEYHRYPVIKIEGLEHINTIVDHFRHLNPNSIHLFLNQKFGYSFDWHKDDTDVILYVLRGKKTLYVRDKIHVLYPGQYTIIPKGYLHRASSCKNTWALSIGY